MASEGNCAIFDRSTSLLLFLFVIRPPHFWTGLHTHILYVINESLSGGTISIGSSFSCFIRYYVKVVWGALVISYDYW